MSKNKEIFAEPFYRDIQKWQKKTGIMTQDVPVIKAEFKKFIDDSLRPIDREILFDDLIITAGKNLTEDGLRVLVRLETWAFEK